ncbi:protein translocase subunit SecF [[Clostridium] symbiosum]|uniref:protein translocase subunit SecF n=1 Tax=Clostridium symbiosum TaxID=1512 RepID=UPI001D076AE4|nr:protein translocase subunit SecF [[Clostridium] symbiosum]MCB6609507.1 protein translocase subunit SecF [[Clostridium] symbiosum]MCB6929500.1 protein translocase subunit SecF [[Clostridium] symbiosum]
MKNKKNHIWIVGVIIAVFVYAAVFGCGNDIKGIGQMRFGIDIRGGVEAVFEPAGDYRPSESELESARDVIEGRLDAKNILDREVTVDRKAGHVIVRFPWKSDEKNFNPEEAIAELGETARLTFRDEEGNILVEGKDVNSSEAVRDPNTGESVVSLSFDRAGAEAFAEATKKMTGKRIGIYMDETLISAPVVKQAITGGTAMINGMDSPEEAKALSEKIRAGALPFSMETTNYNTISPTLGNQALKSMATAGALSMVLICLFMMIYYRLPGVVSCLTLLFQMSLQVLAISIPQYTITLPGIAGLILSAGMAVDANIIISERISEELRNGMTVKQAVRRGYKNAFSSVLDGNITTAAVAAILMFFGSGTMLSFGYTLLTGVLINLFAGVWMSRTILNSLIEYPFFGRITMFRKKKEKKVLGFSKKRKWILLFTCCVLLSGTTISAVNGMELDTQFTGGVILKYTYDQEADTEAVRSGVEQELGRPASVQTSEDPLTGEKKLVLTLAGNKGISPEEQGRVTALLNSQGGDFALSETFAVEPYIGAKALKNSVTAVVLSALFIIIYIRLRFSSLSGLAAGVSAVLALIHDILIVVFIFGIFRIPVNDAFVAVTLTIIGYSINDTIVLYDRIRENMKETGKKTSLSELVDRSITETLGRSINTALTVVMSIFIVYIFSVVYRIESIQVFSLPLLAGLISGCYSSVCIAGPLWAYWEERKKAK